MKKVLLIILMLFCINTHVFAQINDTSVDVSVGKIIKKEYKITKGANQKYEINSSSYMSFEIKTNKEIKEIIIKINGKILDKSKYNFSKIPLEVNISNDYLKTLDFKKHEIIFELEDGSASTNFELEKESLGLGDIFDLPPDTYVKFTKDVLILLVGGFAIIKIILSRKK